MEIRNRLAERFRRKIRHHALKAAERQPALKEIRRFWIGIQTEAKLPDVRIHDLRHTFASLLVSGGASLEMIGKLLGHSQMQTTLRYAHLMDSPLRAGVDAVASAFRPKPRLVHDADDQGGRKTA